MYTFDGGAMINTMVSRCISVMPNSSKCQYILYMTVKVGGGGGGGGGFFFYNAGWHNRRHVVI